MIASAPDNTVEIRHAHLFCGLGGGAKGFNRASPRLGNQTAKLRCIGGIDNDPAAIRDFSRAAGVPGTVMDLFDRGQYVAWHGKEPPASWREAGPDDIRRAFGGERPHIVFTSAPCKGLSGLLSETKSKTEKYQALNRLTVRGIWLTLEAFRDDPVEFILLENVPRIATRGRPLLDQIMSLLKAYGYIAAETTHDCGEMGGLAQSRKRFLLVARHAAKVPPFLYQPPKRPLRGVGEILGKMLMPGDPRSGPMHRCPALQFQTWVRLAFVEAGSDWRSLNKLALQDGVLRDFLLVPEMHRGVLGVNRWGDTTGTIAGRSTPTNGAFSVADPRFASSKKWNDGQQYGVIDWGKPSSAIAGQQAPGQGRYAVSDPRNGISENKQNNCFRVVRWDRASGAVTDGTGPSADGLAVADPRLGWDSENGHGSKMEVMPFDGPAKTITGSRFGSGALCVADPRTTLGGSENYLTGGHYGVLPWDTASGAVSSAACHDNGRWSVADPRPLPCATDRLVTVIRAMDGTWHRPFTTLELAALQSLVDPEEQFVLDGLNDQAWRERIGNAVPAGAAQAIGETMGLTLMLAWSGEGFALSNVPIWVSQIAVALSVSVPPLPFSE